MPGTISHIPIIRMSATSHAITTLTSIGSLYNVSILRSISTYGRQSPIVSCLCWFGLSCPVSYCFSPVLSCPLFYLSCICSNICRIRVRSTVCFVLSYPVFVLLYLVVYVVEYVVVVCRMRPTDGV